MAGAALRFRFMVGIKQLWVAALPILLAGCAGSSWDHAGSSLAGTWRLKLDENDVGLQEKWYAEPLISAHSIALPASLASAGFGAPFDPQTGRYRDGKRPYLAWPSAGYDDQTRADELGALVPARIAIGAGWYERSLRLPERLLGTRVRLRLERVKWTSRLWIDGIEIHGRGTQSLATAHVYEFLLKGAGPHRFTLRIDNRPAVPIGLAGHAYGMETEPIWNGVVGAMSLEPVMPVPVRELRIHPAKDRRSVAVELALPHDASWPRKAQIVLEVRREGSGTVLGRVSMNAPADPKATLRARVPLSAVAKAWDEFHRPLYRFAWTIKGKAGRKSVGARRFGFRVFEARGKRLLLNGIPLFLRGNLDCAVHPGSETPPTDRSYWERVLGIEKRAGFNHIRFHTYCPPEEAFEVADELGLYLQVETAYWVDNWIHDRAPFPPRIGEDESVDAWVLAEARRMLASYGHHPSFAFLCLGNEFGMGSDWKKVARIVAALRKATDTVLVSGTTARRSVPEDQFWVTHATPSGPTRGTGPAHSDWDFSKSLEAASVPIVSHETGQRQSWPDYERLLPAFGSVVRPYNLLRLKARAEKAGIHDHRARCRASVLFAHRLYKAEHEAMRRTPLLAGYQLLMLSDFTGQGEAHVGLLDPFFREKPGIRLADIRAWNGPTVPLARFSSRIWTTTQSFEARLELAHQGPGTLAVEHPSWTLRDVSHHKLVASGRLGRVSASPGSLMPLGALRVPLAKVEAPAQLSLEVRVGAHRNAWNLWVYGPPAPLAPNAAPIRVTQRLDPETRASLERGEDVLLLFDKAIGPKLQKTHWRSTYWTGAWGWGSGLGLLCDPSHAALAGFPTDGSSDWQWRELTRGASCLTLDAKTADQAVIVEHLSTFHHPARQAYLLEFRVGKGRLLACGFDLLRGLERRHATRAFRESLLRYMRSDAFRPEASLSTAELMRQFQFVEALDAVATASSQAHGFEAQKAIDGDTTTLWHTPWGAGETQHPHELTLDFKKTELWKGLWIKGRSDGNNGRLVDISVYATDKRGNWGRPVLSHARLADSAEWQRLDFAPTEARYLRLVTHREAKGRPFASLAELQPIRGSR